MSFIKTPLAQLNIDPFGAIGQDWMLITAAKPDGTANTMTASWGGLGVLWGQDVALVFIRPQRYTKEFIDSTDHFSLTFFDGQKKALSLLGSVSGRERDKITESGLHLTDINGVPTFTEARVTLICEKLYADTIKPECFLPTGTENDAKWYPNKDYHILYIAKIQDAYINAD